MLEGLGPTIGLSMVRAFNVLGIFSQQTVLELLLCARHWPRPWETAVSQSVRVPYLVMLTF